MPKSNPRFCPTCEIQLKKYKRKCENINCSESCYYTRGGGTTVLNRESSSNHGTVKQFERSYPLQESPTELNKLLKERNTTFEITNGDSCTFCSNRSKCKDHLVPMINRQTHTYGRSNCLNYIPICSSCNNKKGNKSTGCWINSLDWGNDKKRAANTWVENNNKYLKFSDDIVPKIELVLMLNHWSHLLMHNSIDEPKREKTEKLIVLMKNLAYAKNLHVIEDIDTGKPVSCHLEYE